MGGESSVAALTSHAVVHVIIRKDPTVKVLVSKYKKGQAFHWSLQLFAIHAGNGVQEAWVVCEKAKYK